MSLTQCNEDSSWSSRRLGFSSAGSPVLQQSGEETTNKAYFDCMNFGADLTYKRTLLRVIGRHAIDSHIGSLGCPYAGKHIAITQCSSSPHEATFPVPHAARAGSGIRRPADPDETVDARNALLYRPWWW